MQAEEEIKGTRNPFKKMYTKIKTQQFLKSVKNLSFEKFQKKSAQRTSVICPDYFENAKEIAEKLVPILSKELEKKSNIKKMKEKKDASCKYLLKIKVACSNLIHIVSINEGGFKPTPKIEALEKLQIAFKDASKFLDQHKISFLSNKEVRTYMTDQSKILNESIDKIKKGIQIDNEA